MPKTYPNKKNFCGGNFQDWLEVMLIGKCNGKCSFCIEKGGFKPKENILWKEIADKIINTKKQNVLLLGGEPTLYPKLSDLIKYITLNGQNVHLTTNGSSLIRNETENLFGLKTLNISIHHYDLNENKKITGINLDKNKLITEIKKLKDNDSTVRINCNIIKGYIDSKNKINKFIKFAKNLGAEGVRFAELKNDNRFVDLCDIFNGQYGLNKNPFIEGCWQNTIINDMPINFRQLCGMQSNYRPEIQNPQQILKKVLYYDGKLYNGWQTEANMSSKQNTIKGLKKIIKDIKADKLSEKEAQDLLAQMMDDNLLKHLDKLQEKIRNLRVGVATGSGCVY